MDLDRELKETVAHDLSLNDHREEEERKLSP